MLSIAAEVIQHHLNVDQEKKLIQQRRQHALERKKAIMDEVDKLLIVGFI